MTHTITENMYPCPAAIELSSRVPYTVLQALRSDHMENPQAKVFEALDNIGIEPIADLVSRGHFIYDVALSINVPITMIHRWIESDHSRLEKIMAAEEYSAEYYLSRGTKEILDIDKSDTDAARVAKIKADHLKWIASRKDKKKYGDQRSSEKDHDSSVHFNITIQDTNNSKVNDGIVIDI